MPGRNITEFARPIFTDGSLTGESAAANGAVAPVGKFGVSPFYFEETVSLNGASTGVTLAMIPANTFVLAVGVYNETNLTTVNVDEIYVSLDEDSPAAWKVIRSVGTSAGECVFDNLLADPSNAGEGISAKPFLTVARPVVVASVPANAEEPTRTIEGTVRVFVHGIKFSAPAV